MVVPELPVSTVHIGACRFPPWMVTVSADSHISAPIALQAFKVSLVSADIRGLKITDLPLAIAARRNALCVWLLEGGGDTTPLIEPP
jgi:hypothetical protein